MRQALLIAGAERRVKLEHAEGGPLAIGEGSVFSVVSVVHFLLSGLPTSRDSPNSEAHWLAGKRNPVILRDWYSSLARREFLRVKTLLPCLIGVGFAVAASCSVAYAADKPETTPKTAPSWVKTIDQGDLDPRLKGYKTPEGVKVEIVAENPVVVNPTGLTFADDGALRYRPRRRQEAERLERQGRL